ncbi:outer membrane protein assembly factor BamB family protein [Halobiforma nitratireducens]|uniref:Serine/threonine protein kinase-like protein n=1 Tax=Halobiforma nitratireducens JCM 10879 TaxID=1227454 RepID=M0LUR9_9EURY|nr:PQQ-binding-like beta-propeller repeat protein [Halobiforma nitratireducens]EMA37317.1 serine/threonine protein kinase-like protein [Halobiforma nitratireducens JCM 10879]
MPSTRRSVLAACTVGIGSLAGCLSSKEPTTDGSWPKRTWNNAHTGYSTTDGPTTDLHTVWRRNRSHSRGGDPSPVVDDGVLYLAYSRGAREDECGGTWIEAFDAATGDSQWTTELFRADERRFLTHSDSTVVDGDRLFHETPRGLTMLTTDGERRWTFDFASLSRGQPISDVVTPIVTDDVVVTGTYGSPGDGRDEIVYGIDPATGTERWNAAFSEWASMWHLAAADGTVYVPFRRTGLVALDPTTGDERWRWEGPLNGTPTVVDDLLLVPLRGERDDEHTLVALNRRDRSVRWRRSIGYRWSDAKCAVANGLIYHVAAFGLEARRLETGERVWRFGPEEGTRPEGVPQVDLVSTPVVSGAAVYVPGWVQRDTMYGHLFVVDARTGDELGRAEIGRNEHARKATPAVTSDLVFLGSNHGTLRAFAECSFEVGGRCLRD